MYICVTLANIAKTRCIIDVLFGLHWGQNVSACSKGDQYVRPYL